MHKQKGKKIKWGKREGGKAQTEREENQVGNEGKGRKELKTKWKETRAKKGRKGDGRR